MGSDPMGSFELTVLAMLLGWLSTAYFILVERASFGFRDLSPQYCPIYDDYFWRHERFSATTRAWR